MIRFSTLPILFFGLTAPVTAQVAHSRDAPQAGDAAAVRPVIDAGNAAYIAAFKRADANALSQVYDPQGSRLNEGSVVVRGRKAIAADMGIPGT
jgi:hypothetical protein